jgi:3-deoxy-manno-octulosonate cytidylyltransferase (CMP-KDO synthetase)
VNIAVIIPARMASTRLPGKPMLNIDGLPMLERVRQQVLKSKSVSKVYIATCDDIIEKYFFNKEKTKVIRTSSEHKSGTSRCGEAINMISGNYTHVVLVQGDEPLINPYHIDQFIETIKQDEYCKAWNAVSDCKKIDFTDHSVVKAVISNVNQIVFCFRVPPFLTIEKKHFDVVKKMQGMMAFTIDYLKDLCAMNSGVLDSTESIEQLKIIEKGGYLKAVHLPNSHPSVNTKSDLLRVISILKKGGGYQIMEFKQ